MSRRLRQMSDAALDDPKAEEARRDIRAAVSELQVLPAAGLVVKTDVALASGVATPIAHGLGRVPQVVVPSAIRGASTVGMITETRDGTLRRDQFVVLTATGYGATITVDLVLL